MEATKLASVILIMCILATVVLVQPVDAQVTFGPTINLSNNVSSSDCAQVAASGNSVYLVWIDGTGCPFPGVDVFFKKSHDNGATFGSTINLSNNGECKEKAVISVSGSNVYVAWEECEVVSGIVTRTDIFFRASTNSGATFGPVINLSSNSGESFGLHMAASGNNVYVTWHDGTPGNFDIFFRASTNSGATFGPVINLSSNSSPSFEPDIAAAGSNVYVAWYDITAEFDILFRLSTNNGATFGSTVNLSNNLGASGVPEIAASGSNVYVAWQDFTPGDADVFFRASNDEAANFGPTINLSNSPGFSEFPVMASSGSNVYVAWNDFGSVDVFFRRSSDNGATFDTKINLSGTGSSEHQQIAISGSNVYIVWTDGSTGALDVLFTISTDSGATFGSAINLSNTPGGSSDPQIAVSGSNVYVEWQDNTTPNGQLDVFFRASSPPSPPLGRTVGGEIIPIDTTSLFILGAFTNAYWVLPLIVIGALIAFIKIKMRKHGNKC